MECKEAINMEHTEWVFTFGSGQYPFNSKCVRIHGTYGDARKKMFDLVGSKWGFQYSAEQWDEMKNDKSRIYPLEEEILLEELEEFIASGGRIGEYL